MSDESPNSASDAAPAALRIESGTCYAIFAYEVGLSIDLDEAQRRITAAKQRESIRRKRRAPHYFEFQPAPLRVTQSVTPIKVGRHTTNTVVDSVIYDFGAVSVTYSIPLAGPFHDLLALGNELWDHPELLTESRRVAAAILDTIAPAVRKFELCQLVEDYVIYQIDAVSPPHDSAEIIHTNGPLIAQILRAEESPLSRQETDDAIACQLSFAPDDRAIVDWNAALLFDRDADDVRAVLEFANVELLEMRFLDDRLDDALDQAYAAISKPSRRRHSTLGAKQSDLWRIAELQMDGALLFEGVNNALKLLGDQYLARLYRLTSQRFHLNDWDVSIRRKLQTIESIYEKISDQHANRRIEALEWIIIILIALEIVMSLFFWFWGH